MAPVQAGKGRKKKSRGPGGVTEDDMLVLVGKIYEAGMDDSQWPAVLRATVRLMGNTGSHLFLMDEATGLVSHTVHVDMPDQLMAEYNSEVVRICPRYRNAVEHPEWDLLWDHQHIDEAEIDRSEYYDWLQDRGEGIRYYLGGRLRPSGGPEGFLSLAFRKTEGHATREHIRLFGKLLPHFNRSLELGRRVGTRKLAMAASLEFLNQLSDAVVLLGDGGVVLAANRAALALARHGGPVLLATHGLRLADRRRDGELQSLVADALKVGIGEGIEAGGTLALSGEQPAVITVVPIPRSRPSWGLGVVRAAVLIRLPHVAARIDPLLLRQAFGLTAAEARLAAEIARGASLQEAAQAARTSIHTARSQLKQVFAKTGTHRQAELVRLLSTIARL